MRILLPSSLVYLLVLVCMTINECSMMNLHLLGGYATVRGFVGVTVAFRNHRHYKDDYFASTPALGGSPVTAASTTRRIIRIQRRIQSSSNNNDNNRNMVEERAKQETVHNPTTGDVVGQNHPSLSSLPSTQTQQPTTTTTTTSTAVLLDPFLPAADPRYMCEGAIGQGDFIIAREGPPTLDDELSNENILKIVRSECSDLEVNTLVWKCLGYRFNTETKEWMTSDQYCFPKWKERFPTPPDLIGMQRIYTKDIDQASLKSNQALVRSIPVEYKQQLKHHLRPLGFTGFQYAELTPNKTRRAQCANWLLYYREQLYGVSVQELQARRQKRLQEQQQQEQQQEQQQQQQQEQQSSNANPPEWTPPVTTVF